MKKHLVKITATLFATVLLLSLAACKEDENKPPIPPKPITCFPVEPIISDSDLSKQLDDYFEGMSHNCFYTWNVEARLVINSQEDFWKEYWIYGSPFLFDPENIDFEQYTLVAWCMTAICGGCQIKQIEMCVDTLKQAYTITEIWPIIDETTMGTYPYHYWRLYPKFNPDFDINFLFERRDLW